MGHSMHDQQRDQDGVRVFTSGRARRAAGMWVGLAVFVIGALTVGAVAVLRGDPAPDTAPGPAAPAAAVLPVEVPKVLAAADSPPRREVRAVRVEAAPAVRAPVAAPDTPPAAPVRRAAAAEKRKQLEMERVARDLIDALIAAGETGGIAAFPPPGTDPIKPGIVVPEDFEVPEGYVRHYQVTDDGEQLEAILMFSPDYEFLDANGNPIELPADRIVPAEMAPPELPLRTLEVPDDPASTGGSRR
jgi:hypothetical protein